MFENYVGAKHAVRPAWVSILIAVSVAVHAVAAGALIIRSFWMIEKLTPPEATSVLSLGAPPPPPPPKGRSKPDTLKDQIVKKQKVQDMVQPEEKPEEVKPEEIAQEDDDGEDFGVEGGVEGGVAGGVVGGVLGGVPGGTLGGTGVAPPPPVQEKPQIVPQVVLKEYRLSGESDIKPPESVKNLMVKQAMSKTVGTVKMCLSKGGSVQSVRVLKSTGFDDYDATIVRKMQQWKYRPFKVNGKAVPVCTSVTFIYRQT